MNITKCKHCGSENLKFERTPTTIHFGKLVCGHCNTFSHWAKNPESPRANTLRVNQKSIREIMAFHGQEKEFCFFCQRKRKELGDKETLTIDHIEELNHGGKDQIDNMQILCSACHKLKNWCRLYMNWHLKKEGENENNHS